MMSPLSVELHAEQRRADLLREAEQDRLSRRAGIRPPTVRSTIAALLVALAVRLDASTAQAPVDNLAMTARV